MKRLPQFTQEQLDMIYSMNMYQSSLNDIATTACLDAFELVSHDKAVYRQLVKRLANQLRDAARDYDHHSVLTLSDEKKMHYADYFDAWQDATSDSLTRLRMCIKNDIDRRKEPSGNALSAVLIAQALADFARRRSLATAYDIHKACSHIRLKASWYIGARLANIASQLVDALTPKGCEYSPSEDTRKAALAVTRILESPETSERIEKSISEMYKKEEQ